MNALCYIPGLFLTALCHIIVIYYMSEHRFSRSRYLLYGCAFGAFFVGFGWCMYTLQGVVALFPYILISLSLFLFCCLASRDSVPKKSFLFITYFYIFTVFDNGLKLAVRMLFPHVSALSGYYAAIVPRSAILLLLLALYVRYASDTLRSLGNSSRRWWNQALIALLFYLVQLTLSIENARNEIEPTLLLLLFAIVSFIMCAVYGLIFANIDYMKKEAESALVRQNAEYLSAQLSALQNAEETHRRLRHDMRHHLETIAGYAREGDTAGILAYIREYSIEVSETAAKRYSVNRTVNNILAAYAGKAEESGVTFAVKCNVPENLAVRDIDMIALLGNLLENALHGCQKSGKEQPGIDVHIRQQRSRLIIVCDNACCEDLKLNDGLPSEKGVGISSILHVCRKYDGNLGYHLKNGMCSACAVLNL